MLVLSSLDPDLPDEAAMIEEVETKVLEGRNTPVHFAFEYFDSSVFPADQAGREKTVSFLQQKYHGRSFDLVLTIGGRTLDFAEKYHTRLFPAAALLFFVVDAEGIPSSRKTVDIGGVVRKLNYLPTLQLALRQNPGTRRVVVISGSSDVDKLEMAAAHDQFRAYEPDIDFQYWADLNVSDLRSRLTQVDADAVVLFLDYLQDPNGEKFTPSRILRTVSSGANRPIYGTYSSFVESGIVGGSVVDMREIGRVLGQTAVRSLNGEKAESIPLTVAEFQHYMFDWRQLHRWNIAADQLPAGSAVLNYQYSPWEIYRWRIVGLVALLGIESALIALLLRNNATRKRAEIALQNKEEQLAEAQRLAQLTAWRWDPKSDLLTCSDTFFSLTGFDPKRSTCVFKELSAFFTDESLARLTEEMTASLESGAPFELELKGQRPDRTQVWMAMRGEAVRNSEGQVIQLRGTMQDISERKQEEKEAKAALAELSGRLIQAQEQERSRIAGELHDDISQRLALLANCLGELKLASDKTDQAGEEQQLEAVFRLANEIANDVQNLSHRLHPSKLNYVGLASAARQLCQEVSRQHKIETECQVQDIPRDIEEHISLSLFRTLQESLRNVVKHSHAKHVKVELMRLGAMIRLRVSDDGVGFDSKSTGSHGLGLVSMQERLRSVGGEFSIWSRPSLGTQVEATVPVRVGVARSA